MKPLFEKLNFWADTLADFIIHRRQMVMLIIDS
jgi:hypothetical protein